MTEGEMRNLLMVQLRGLSLLNKLKTLREWIATDLPAYTRGEVPHFVWSGREHFQLELEVEMKLLSEYEEMLIENQTAAGVVQQEQE